MSQAMAGLPYQYQWFVWFMFHHVLPKILILKILGCERVAITRNCAILNSFAKGLTESILNSFLQLFLQNCDSLTPDSFGKGAYWVDSSTLNSWIAHTLGHSVVALNWLELSASRRKEKSKFSMLSHSVTYIHIPCSFCTPQHTKSQIKRGQDSRR